MLFGPGLCCLQNARMRLADRPKDSILRRCLNLLPFPPIPHRDFALPCVDFEEKNEALVDITALGDPKILTDFAYYRQGIPGAVRQCLVRESVAERLLRAARALPEVLCFKIYDAWRPFAVQQYLYEQYRQQVKKANPGMAEEAIDRLTQNFVSYPQRDRIHSPVHSTGGAVDLTLAAADGTELNMGTAFDSFSEKAHTAYFEDAACADPEIRQNRRMLYHILCREGFTNLPTEWWHFDYGDRFWAHYTDSRAMYTGVFETEGCINEKD